MRTRPLIPYLKMNFDDSLLIDLYELTMAQGYFFNMPQRQATFELFVRDLGKQRSFLIAAGLEDILNFVKALRFTDRHINYLKKKNLFKDEFLRYLKDFRFKGDIWAMPEGSVFFANQPVLRVTANIMEAQTLESFLLNTINLQTMIATKAARVVIAAKERPVYDFALRRTQGKDAALKVARSSYIAGFRGTSNVLAGFTFNIPIAGTMAHSFVMAHKTEIDSFKAYARVFPQKSILLVDTYDTERGIDNAIRVGLMLKSKGFRLLGIRLDSGDLVCLSKKARKKLNQAGFNFVKIFASGSLDEYKIANIIRRGAEIDNFGVGTNMGVSSDAPYLDVIYKLVEIGYDSNTFLPTMKLSHGKFTYPGRKQIFRIKDKDGKYKKDILGLEDEKITRGVPLLVKVVNQGKIIYELPSLEQIRRFTQQNLSKLPQRFKQLYTKSKYPVLLSQRLKRLTSRLSKDLTRSQMLQDFAFLDVDTQYDFMNPKGGLYIKGAVRIIKQLKRLTEFADKNNITVISSLDTHKRDDVEFRQFPSHCVKGTSGHQKIKETLTRSTRQIFIEKHTFNLFSNPKAKNILEPFGTVYVYGVATDYCVREAVLGLRALGKTVYLLIDAIMAVSNKGNQQTLRLLKEKGVIFIKTAQLITKLS